MAVTRILNQKGNLLLGKIFEFCFGVDVSCGLLPCPNVLDKAMSSIGLIQILLARMIALQTQTQDLPPLIQK